MHYNPEYIIKFAGMRRKDSVFRFFLLDGDCLVSWPSEHLVFEWTRGYFLYAFLRIRFRPNLARLIGSHIEMSIDSTTTRCVWLLLLVQPLPFPAWPIWAIRTVRWMSLIVSVVASCSITCPTPVITIRRELTQVLKNILGRLGRKHTYCRFEHAEVTIWQQENGLTFLYRSKQGILLFADFKLLQGSSRYSAWYREILFRGSQDLRATWYCGPQWHITCKVCCQIAMEVWRNAYTLSPKKLRSCQTAAKV